MKVGFCMQIQHSENQRTTKEGSEDKLLCPLFKYHWIFGVTLLKALTERVDVVSKELH